MKRTPLNRVGKIGRANLAANKLIRAYIQENSINPVCELGLSGCLGRMFLTIAHRHKRAWYKGNVELLADPNEWISACQNCHATIEVNRDLTEGVFEKLRPR